MDESTKVGEMICVNEEQGHKYKTVLGRLGLCESPTLHYEQEFELQRLCPESKPNQAGYGRKCRRGSRLAIRG